MSGHLRRLLETLGIRREARQVETLADYLDVAPDDQVGGDAGPGRDESEAETAELGQPENASGEAAS